MAKIILFGIILLSGSFFGSGEYSIERKEREGNFLSEGNFPCSSNIECLPLYGPNSKCEFGACRCYGDDGNPLSCPSLIDRINNNRVQQYQGRVAGGPEIFLGSTCNTNADCSSIFFSKCNNTKKCDCPENYVAANDRKHCLKVADRLGEICQINLQCSQKFPNSTCSNDKKCECEKNYHNVDQQCWKQMGFQEKCTNDRECNQMSGYCNQNEKTCLCRDGAVINSRNAVCLDISKHMGHCLDNVQCERSLGNAVCVEKQCQCVRNYHFVEDEKKCIKSRVLGDSCEKNEECFLTARNDTKNFLVCDSGKKVCTCIDGFERVGYECQEEKSGASATTLFTSSLFLMVLLAFLF